MGDDISVGDAVEVCVPGYMCGIVVEGKLAPAECVTILLTYPRAKEGDAHTVAVNRRHVRRYVPEADEEAPDAQAE